LACIDDAHIACFGRLAGDRFARPRADATVLLECLTEMIVYLEKDSKGAGLILRIEKTSVVALAGVIAQIFVHWAINVDATRQTLRPNG